MLNICLDLQDLNSKTCEIHVETGHRRRKTVQFPYLILLFVFISLIVYAGFYYYHLAKISITYSVKDFILDRNRFFSELYFYRIRKILSSSTVSGNRNESDVILRNRQRTSMRLCSGTTYLRSKTKSSGNVSKSAESFSMEDVEAKNTDVTAGGAWKPTNCLARHQVAIIIPYRNRRPHLIALLNTLVPTLKLQNIHFKIYVSEQYGNETYNKGVLMNAAYKQALQEQDWHCFVFHDVDLIPEDVRNMYTCPQQPRHMSPAIDEMGYELPYENLVGGVFSLRTEHFRQLNGYSNSYWGWGAEDDDMSVRLKQMGFRIDRPPLNIARYKMIKHKKRAVAAFEHRYIPLSKAKHRFHIDGLNSVKYKLISKTAEPLYTHLLIDVGPPPIGARG